MTRIAHFIFTLFALASISVALGSPYLRPAFVGSFATSRRKNVRPVFTKENDEEIMEAEDAAAYDAHDCSDPGMEAAAEERAVMMAYEIMDKRKKGVGFVQNHERATANPKTAVKMSLSDADDEGVMEAEEAAAYDAHDCSDPGMEAAAEERAVHMAYEIMDKRKKGVGKGKNHERATANLKTAVKMSLSDADDEEIMEAEEAAAYDAHDCSDPGMEAVAEERAVMMAYDIIEAKKKEAKEKREKATKAEHHEEAKSAEEFAQMMQRAVEDLQKSIGDNFKGENKREFTKEEVANVAIDMLERAAMAVAAKRYETEEKLMATHEATMAAMEERNIDAALVYTAMRDAQAADARTQAVETFDTADEVAERKRDAAVSHAAHHLEDDAKHLLDLDNAKVRRFEAEEDNIHGFLEQLEKNEAELKATLKELRLIIKEKAVESWKN